MEPIEFALMEQPTPPVPMETNPSVLMELFFRDLLVMMEIDQFVLTGPLLKNLGDPTAMMGGSQPALMGTVPYVLMVPRLHPVQMEADQHAWMTAGPCALMGQAL